MYVEWREEEIQDHMTIYTKGWSTNLSLKDEKKLKGFIKRNNEINKK